MRGIAYGRAKSEEVEVTKEYIPSVEQAPQAAHRTRRLTDTTQMRPEIVYAVISAFRTPILARTATHPSPTTVTF